jgi:hypothetical protein
VSGSNRYLGCAKLLLISLLTLAASGGCKVIENGTHVLITEPHQFPNNLNRYKTIAANRELSRQHYADWAACCSPDAYFSVDYASGFEDGFVDYLTYGGDGQPPIMPPRRYWKLGYHSPDGYVAITEWFNGWEDGVTQAQASGYREFATVPSSVLMGAGEYPMEFQGESIEPIPPTDVGGQPQQMIPAVYTREYNEQSSSVLAPTIRPSAVKPTGGIRLPPRAMPAVPQRMEPAPDVEVQQLRKANEPSRIQGWPGEAVSKEPPPAPPQQLLDSLGWMSPLRRSQARSIQAVGYTEDGSCERAYETIAGDTEAEPVRPAVFYYSYDDPVNRLPIPPAVLKANAFDASQPMRITLIPRSFNLDGAARRLK